MTIRQFMSGVWSGKSIGRMLLNEKLERILSTLHGNVLDLAGDRRASYSRLLPKGLSVTIANETGASNPDTRLDFNEPLPFASDSFDTVLLLNALYIAREPVAVLKECRRVLRSHGRLILSTPFIAHEMPEPHDYVRWTEEGLDQLLHEAGFVLESLDRVGGRCTAAAGLLHPVLRWNIVRMCAYGIALGMDAMVRDRDRLHPCPILYIAIGAKEALS